VPVSLKYAVVERERRFLVAGLPDGVTDVREVVDRYVTGTRLRLREVRAADGTVVRKLTQKARLGEGPEEVACTTLYLEDAEWAALSGLPGRTLRKRRHLVVRDGLRVAVDEHVDGTLVAELDEGDAGGPVPAWLDVVAEVTHDEAWTGAGLAHRLSPGG
jgi:CYTH domain-containing protein